ncbi:hypothetical protein K6L44_07585, partial [Gluconacetobacter entanii]|uniref:hypothetical protein n=1 Tax=Gluconacetobacter entanii TaxID=108528 RepID=UPI001C93631C
YICFPSNNISNPTPWHNSHSARLIHILNETFIITLFIELHITLFHGGFPAFTIRTCTASEISARHFSKFNVPNPPPVSHSRRGGTASGHPLLL